MGDRKQRTGTRSPLRRVVLQRFDDSSCLKLLQTPFFPWFGFLLLREQRTRVECCSCSSEPDRTVDRHRVESFGSELACWSHALRGRGREWEEERERLFGIRDCWILQELPTCLVSSDYYRFRFDSIQVSLLVPTVSANPN